MKLIIDIPNIIYQRYLKGERDLGDADVIMNRIKNGTPLPKGHGRLIDADAYIDKHEECGWLDDIAVNEFNTNAPTIIEADTESEG